MKFHQKTILIMLCSVLLCMSGCVKSSDKIIKESLKNKYGEDFIIHETKTLPGGFDATVSPVSNPEILFVARIQSDGTYSFDDYDKRYVDYLLRKKLEKDFAPFFPDVAIFVDSKFSFTDENIDYTGSSLKELIEGMNNGDGYIKEASVYVFVNFDVGTTKKYAEEYDYLTDILDQEIKNNEMIPLKISFFRVDSETKERIKEYFSEDIDIDGYFVSEIVKANEDDFWEGVRDKNQTELGNPPRIVVCFGKDIWKDYLDVEEYTRRRELLETAP